jgi:hypothetical protein
MQPRPVAPAAGLCGECTARFSIVRCEPCLLVHNRAAAAAHWTNLFLTAALVAIGLAFYALVLPPQMRLGSQAPVLVLLFPSVFWGWKFLGERQQAILLLSPPVWLVLLIVRLTLSALVGLIVAPWRVFVAIREIVTIRRTSRAIAARTI